MSTMGDLTEALTRIRHGTVARYLLAEVLHVAEQEGILTQIQKLSSFSQADLCRLLQSELGYVLEQGNRRRMIGLLLSLLRECGWVGQAGGRWQWSRDDSSPIPGSGDGTIPAMESPDGDGQYLFFRRCLDSVPAYLRGGSPSFLFDEQNAEAWELFLGCTEFQICRALLLDLMGIQNRPSFRLLDLCHGPGWGVEAALSRYPAIRISALDFTDVFSRKARARSEETQARNRQRGDPVVPVAWLGPDRWKGFGDPLPFPDASFEAVLFSCGDPYVPPAARGEVYREIKRVLVPEGRLGVLTRCLPAAGACHIPSFWLRISALVHDFAESVCEGWQGFSEAEEHARIFSAAGFVGGVSRLGSMSLLESSLWVLRKGGCHG